MRFILFASMTVGGAIGWWLVDFGGAWWGFLGSTAGSLAGVFLAYRLTRDYF